MIFPMRDVINIAKIKPSAFCKLNAAIIIICLLFDFTNRIADIKKLNLIRGRYLIFELEEQSF